MSGSVNDIGDDELLRRAVTSARLRSGKHPRWTAVSAVFLLGSTYSYELCQRFGLDPDEMVTK